MATLTPLKPWEMQVLAVSAWRDPEFWGALDGVGCARCAEGEPVIWGLKCGALCWDCLTRSLPGWPEDRLIRWLGSQREAYIRSDERRKVFKAASGAEQVKRALDYELWYGVWLLGRPHP